jgi:hypothetical protein
MFRDNLFALNQSFRVSLEHAHSTHQDVFTYTGMYIVCVSIVSRLYIRHAMWLCPSLCLYVMHGERTCSHIHYYRSTHWPYAVHKHEMCVHISPLCSYRHTNIYIVGNLPFVKHYFLQHFCNKLTVYLYVWLWLFVNTDPAKQLTWVGDLTWHKITTADFELMLIALFSTIHFGNTEWLVLTNIFWGVSWQFHTSIPALKLYPQLVYS